MKMTGTITAKSPIMITRPGQGDELLTMNVVRNEAISRTHVIPGETIKGLLLSLAYSLCVDAARNSGPLRVDLDQFYKQTAGGLSFTSESKELRCDKSLREKEPLLSLFGSAAPKMTGRIIVHHAIAQPLLNSEGPAGTGLPPGSRNDGMTTNPAFVSLLSGTEKALWSRQNMNLVSFSEANKRVEDAKRILARARKTQGISIEPYVAALNEAQARVIAIREAAEFQHSVQRPIPAKNASPVGTIYDHTIEVVDATDQEVGLLLASLASWALLPRIGGGKTVGYGQIEAVYSMHILSEGLPRRDRRWEEVGRIAIGSEGSPITSDHPVVHAAKNAWRLIEAEIRTQTAIFG